MALDQTQKYTILRYLGWPIRTIDSTSSSYSNIINGRLTGFPDDAIAMLTPLLTRMAAIDTKLQGMVNQSNVKSIDDIEFFQDGTYDLRAERGKLIKEIASMMDMPIGPGACGFNSVGIRI
jgi:hypothetical protein